MNKNWDKDWTFEVQKESFCSGWKVKEKLFSGQSDFQKVEVVDTESHGRMLLNDDLVMITERDEFIYHDMITHVPLFTHPNPKKVLVIGGGDGGTAREVLRHPSVEKCVMVEIDGMVVDACREFIPQTASELSNPKLELHIEDGVKYVAETQEMFDVVLVDSTDPIGPATPLFGVDFYKNVHKILNEDGIVVSQGESAFYEIEAQKSLIQNIKEVFGKAYIYNYSNMTYPGSLWSFFMGTKKLSPLEDFDSSRVGQSGLEFQYYNKSIHKAAFALPEFMRKELSLYIKN